MSAANKKFQSLKGKVIGWKAHDCLKDKELELKSKFPLCRGMFDFCPSEEEMNHVLEGRTDAKGIYTPMAPNVCGHCAVFEESGRSLPVEQRKPVIDETFLKAFGKKK